jgi:two-component system, chemotaxis family, chemotaxis protein CheY
MADRRALVVDDSRAMRTILKGLLQQLGFEVFEGGNGVEALAALQSSGPVDLALVDWNMPEMNGLDFLTRVRADKQHANMKIMMVTTESDMARVSEAIQAGANNYIMKPFTPSAVKEAVQAMGF